MDGVGAVAQLIHPRLQVVVGHVAVQVVHQSFDGRLGTVGVVVDAVNAGGDHVGGVGEVAGGLLRQVGQGAEGGAKLGDAIRPLLNGHVGDHLPHDAAHVLASQHIAVVDAGGHEPVLTTHDAAHVVAHVGIAHAALVGAALDGAGGVTGDAANVGVSTRFGGLLVFKEAVYGALQIGGGDLAFAYLGVDGGGIGTAPDGTVVLPHNAAGSGGGVHHAHGGAVGDNAAIAVIAGDQTHGIRAGDGAGEGAAGDGAVVLAHHAAHAALRPGGRDLALHGQAADGGSGGDAAEKAAAGGTVGEGDAGDAVPLPVEGAEEDGDG